MPLRNNADNDTYLIANVRVYRGVIRHTSSSSDTSAQEHSNLCDSTALGSAGLRGFGEKRN